MKKNMLKYMVVIISLSSHNIYAKPVNSSDVIVFAGVSLFTIGAYHFFWSKSDSEKTAAEVKAVREDVKDISEKVRGTKRAVKNVQEDLSGVKRDVGTVNNKVETVYDHTVKISHSLGAVAESQKQHNDQLKHQSTQLENVWNVQQGHTKSFTVLEADVNSTKKNVDDLHGKMDRNHNQVLTEFGQVRGEFAATRKHTDDHFASVHDKLDKKSAVIEENLKTTQTTLADIKRNQERREQQSNLTDGRVADMHRCMLYTFNANSMAAKSPSSMPTATAPKTVTN